MEIKAAMYGSNKLDFIADSVDQRDIESLLEVLSSAGVKVGRKLTGDATKLELEKGGWAGFITVCPQKGEHGIGNHMVIAMLPYEGRLITPFFASVDVNDWQAIDKILQTYRVPEIIADNARELQQFRERFPQHAARYRIRVQSQYEAEQARGLGIASVPELGL